MTIGEVVQLLKLTGCNERNKQIKIYKFAPGNLNKYNFTEPQCKEGVKLSKYIHRICLLCL